MARPAKPYAVLTSEKKSHRTKRELTQRRNEEKNLVSGVKMKEYPEVRENEYAHKEYMRVKKLLKAIDKEDELYGGVIRRYCLIHAEIKQLEEDREYYSDMIREMRADLHEQKDKLQSPAEYIQILADIAKSMTKISASINSIDRTIQQKRKMMFDIEKESVMTISAALRTIPKSGDKPDNPLLEILGSG